MISVLSGSEVSVSGPAAGLAIIVATAITNLGSFRVFLLAVALSGLIQLVLGFLRAGVIGNYVPNAVIKGMLAAVYRIHQRELDGIADPTARFRRLVELNVQEQVWKLAETSFVQHAWKAEQRPYLHGWVYDLHTGYLRDLLMLTPGTPISDIYKFEFDD